MRGKRRQVGYEGNVFIALIRKQAVNQFALLKITDGGRAVL